MKLGDFKGVVQKYKISPVQHKSARLVFLRLIELHKVPITAWKLLQYVNTILLKQLTAAAQLIWRKFK